MHFPLNIVDGDGASLSHLRRLDEPDRFERLERQDNPSTLKNLDVGGLIAELERTTTAEVRFDDGSRALYATDGSNYRQAPIGVVVPRTIQDVVNTVAAAAKFGAPLLSRAGGTSLAGQGCNVAVLIDFSKYINHVTNIDPVRMLGSCDPGTVLDTFRTAARQHGVTYGPDPATHSHCGLGGMLGNNSCGIHSMMCWKHGLGLRTSDNTHELDILTYDGVRMTVGPTPPEELEKIIAAGGRRGEIYAGLKQLVEEYGDLIRGKFPELPRRVSGYNLDDLLPENGFNVARALVGTEGTCVTILGATMHLVPEPKARSLLILGYPSAWEAGDHVMEILPHMPTGLEGMDHLLYEYVQKKGDQRADLKLLPEGKGFLLVEFGGESKEDADGQARKLMEELGKKDDAPTMKLFDDKKEEEMVWEVRESALGSTAWVPGLADTWPGWEDSAVPPEQVGPYLRALRSLFHKYGYNPSLYGHFGQGCIHCRVDFDLYTQAGIDKMRRFLDEATDLVVSFGGSCSGEHGDGQARGELLPKMFGDELVAAMRQFKMIWDPRWKMNPGKVVDPYPITSNLRIGRDYNPPDVETYFKFPDDKGSFGRAALRCVGVGKCRRIGGGVMCPSYMVTHEEQHATRGRARMLFEMMNGEILDDGWKSEEVKESLDLCLSCKGCTGQCPVSVDIPTYKAEFLAHYYEGKLRPRHMFAFGFIHWWARLANIAPSLVNFMTQAPVLRDIAKWSAQVAPQRSVPKFAPESFKQWFFGREVVNPEGPAVLLYIDTFNNYLHPETGKAAVEVMEHAGWRVKVPREDVCCGRPLYDYGFLNVARRWLKDNLVKLRPWIRAGTPIVVLEPSCYAVFHDELRGMLPEDKDGQRLMAQVYLLSEFLTKVDTKYKPPKLKRKAIVHGHCHHKATATMQQEELLLKEMGLDCEYPDTGCCGMAGAFGFEKGEHYDVAMAAGERVLLPEVRKAEESTLIIADGFSCREQVIQVTDRRPLHLAQVLQLAIRDGERGPSGKPEAALQETIAEHHRAANRKLAYTAAAVAGVGLLAAGMLSAAKRNKAMAEDWLD